MKSQISFFYSLFLSINVEINVGVSVEINENIYSKRSGVKTLQTAEPPSSVSNGPIKMKFNF